MRTSLIFLIFAVIATVSFAQYNEAIAKELAHASYSSYCNNTILSSFQCGNNCKYLAGYQAVYQKEYELSFQHTISYSTFVNKGAKRFVVAFRGTTNVIQLAHEFVKSNAVPCELCKIPGAEVSKYFLNYYDSIFKNEFLAAMKLAAKDYAGYDFYITGHSLGGAFATIASLHLAMEGIFPEQNMYLYTFGSPRVGNRIFARAVTAHVKQAFRIVHDRDAVVHIPPCLSHDFKTCLAPEEQDDHDHDHDHFYGWHISPEIHYNTDFTSYKVCEKEEDPTCSNAISYGSLSISHHKLYFTAKNECKKRIMGNMVNKFKLGFSKLKDKIKEKFNDIMDDSDVDDEEAAKQIGKLVQA